MSKLERNFGNPDPTPNQPLHAPDQPDIHGAFGDSEPGSPVPSINNTPMPPPLEEPEPQSAPMIIDSTFDVRYWRDHVPSAAYAQPEFDYERDYAPAYRLGHAERIRHPIPGQFEDISHDLEGRWEEFKDESRLTWDQAKIAIKEAWDYVSQ